MYGGLLHAENGFPALYSQFSTRTVFQVSYNIRLYFYSYRKEHA